jgi:hypothetical protein
MRVKQYIVTYNNKEVLNKCLESLFPLFKKYSKEEYQVYIINNHSNFHMDSKFQPYVKVLHNVLRPDFSTGHLARNWNEAIINGFKDLNNPDCDILITNQNDCEFDGDFIPNLIELHKKYSFIQFGAGDHFISYTPNSIKKVGLWDERFCNIGYQEADYFLRQLLYNTNECSINDYRHNRTHNILSNTITKNTQSGHDRGDMFHMQSKKYHQISENIYKIKWGNSPYVHTKNESSFSNLSNIYPLINSFMYYPYFEKNINLESLKKQKYIYDI